MIILDDMGHLYSTVSTKELYDFAIKLGMNPEWNHYNRHFPHFDLTTKGKMNLAVKMGAKLVDAREDAELVNLTKDWSRKMYEDETRKGNVYYYKSRGLHDMGWKKFKENFQVRHIIQIRTGFLEKYYPSIYNVAY